MTNGRAAPRDLHPEENVAFCKSDLGIEVGGVLHCATWTANIQKGRVYRLDDYAVPPGTDKSVEEGGICPLRANEIRHPKTGDLMQRFKTWQWQTFGLADHQRFVGKPRPAHIRRAAEELALDSATRPSEVAAE
jgi:hypothetical protein